MPRCPNAGVILLQTERASMSLSGCGRERRRLGLWLCVLPHARMCMCGVHRSECVCMCFVHVCECMYVCVCILCVCV